MPTGRTGWSDQTRAEHDQHLGEAANAIGSAARNAGQIHESAARLHKLGADVTAISAGLRRDWLNARESGEVSTHELLSSVEQQGRAILTAAPPDLSREQLDKHHELLDGMIDALETAFRSATAMRENMGGAVSHLRAMRQMW